MCMSMHVCIHISINLTKIKINHIIKNKTLNRDMKEKCWQGCRGKGPLLHTVGGNMSSAVIINIMGVPRKIPNICIIWFNVLKIKLAC